MGAESVKNYRDSEGPEQVAMEQQTFRKATKGEIYSRRATNCCLGSAEELAEYGAAARETKEEAR